jgi:hypothetical protein
MYNLFDFLGDFGGVIELLILVVGLAITPISEHIFYSNELKNLYSVSRNT